MYDITAKRIDMALIERNLSPQRLSELSGVSKASISQYRHGKNIPNSKSARAMAAVLGVTPEWLMGFGDDDIEHHFDPTTIIINNLWKELTVEQRMAITSTAQVFVDMNRKDIHETSERIRNYHQALGQQTKALGDQKGDGMEGKRTPYNQIPRLLSDEERSRNGFK